MDKTAKDFFEWADLAGIEPDRDNYLCWKAGHDNASKIVHQLRMEVMRLHEIIRERNHEIGIG